MCNKLSLNWSGIPIGHSKNQKLVLRNSSHHSSIRLSVSVQHQHPNFQIVPNNLLAQGDNGIAGYEAVLKPRSELPVYVNFKPTCFASVNASVVLRVLNGTTKYVIPVTGYGGCGNLDINGARKLNDQFFIELGCVYLGKKTTFNVTLRNSGSRGSFVCLKCFSGKLTLITCFLIQRFLLETLFQETPL